MYQVMTIQSMITLMMITMTTSDLFTTWMIMETMNLMFISLCLTDKGSYKATPLIFLVQFVSSTLILMSIIIQTTPSNSEMLLTLGIAIKMGLFPFDSWMTSTFSLMSWKNCLILMSLIKVPPIMISTSMNNPIMMTLMNTMSPMIIILKATKIMIPKKIMALSSSIQSSWMLCTSQSSAPSWMIYFSIYTVHLTALVTIMAKSYESSWSTWSIKSESKMEKTTKIVMILSSMGVPPMITFFIKTDAIKSMYTNHMFTSMSSIMAASILTMIIYSRLFLTSLVMSKVTLKSTSSEYTKPMKQVIPFLMATTLMILM